MPSHCSVVHIIAWLSFLLFDPKYPIELSYPSSCTTWILIFSSRLLSKLCTYLFLVNKILFLFLCFIVFSIHIFFFSFTTIIFKAIVITFIFIQINDIIFTIIVSCIIRSFYNMPHNIFLNNSTSFCSFVLLL